MTQGLEPAFGDVVLVRFVFADEKGAKRRPGLILSSAAYMTKRQEVLLAAITSNVERELYGDSRIIEWHESGLAVPSVVTAILRTIKREMIETQLGRLRPLDLDTVERHLHSCLGFL